MPSWWGPNRGQNQKVPTQPLLSWVPTCGQSGNTTPAVLGVPSEGRKQCFFLSCPEIEVIRRAPRHTPSKPLKLCDPNYPSSRHLQATFSSHKTSCTMGKVVNADGCHPGYHTLNDKQPAFHSNLNYRRDSEFLRVKKELIFCQNFLRDSAKCQKGVFFFCYFFP